MKTHESFLQETNCYGKRGNTYGQLPQQQQQPQQRYEPLQQLELLQSSIYSHNLTIERWWFTLLQHTINLQMFEQKEQQQQFGQILNCTTTTTTTAAPTGQRETRARNQSIGALKSSRGKLLLLQRRKRTRVLS